MIRRTGSLTQSGAAVAMAVALVAFSNTPAERTSNLALSDIGLPETYIMTDQSRANSCYVVDRRDSTVRRSNQGQPGQRAPFDRFYDGEGGSALASWIVRSKRDGTLIFVPIDAVDDWSYPFIYSFVRKKSSDLPAVEWSQLFVDRNYQGLYLRVALPFDPRKKDGRTSPLREILYVRGDRLTELDTRFSEGTRLYVDAVALGVFPELVAPAPELAWLASRCPTQGMTFLMSSLPPYNVQVLPLPISVSGLYEALRGSPPPAFVDARNNRWTDAIKREASGHENPFTEVQLAELRREFALGAASFRKGLRAHAELHQAHEQVRNLLPKRQAASASLGLRLGEL